MKAMATLKLKTDEVTSHRLEFVNQRKELNDEISAKVFICPILRAQEFELTPVPYFIFFRDAIDKIWLSLEA